MAFACSFYLSLYVDRMLMLGLVHDLRTSVERELELGTVTVKGT